MGTVKNKGRWEIYSGTPNRHEARSGLWVTLNQRKVLLLNEAADAAIDRPTAVELRYDLETRTIGLAPKDPRNLNTFPLKRNQTERGQQRKYKYAMIHASPFCKDFEIDPRKTILFTNIDVDNEGTMLLELSTAVAVGRGFR